MKQYIDALYHVLREGEDRNDRTGVGTRSVFGYQMHFDLQEGFPAVTTKKLAFKGVVSELLWFLEGETDERRLAELRYSKPREEVTDKDTIWTANANKQGVDLGYVNTDMHKGLGPVYGAQWRTWRGTVMVHDQIAKAIDLLKNNPDSRRNIVSAWNVDQIDAMALPPCHVMFQFNVRQGKYLDCLLYQRSCDLPLGAPFNIASYALLIHLIARHVGFEPGRLVYTLGDMHIYQDQLDGVREQITREPLALPQLKIADRFSLNNMYGQFPLDSVNDFSLVDYEHHDTIKFNMAT